MTNKTTTFIALALALFTASAAGAANRHPVHHQTATHTAAALQSYASGKGGASTVAREPDYMRIQDRTWGW